MPTNRGNHLDFWQMDLFERVDSWLAYDFARDYVAPRRVLKRAGLPVASISGKNPSPGFEGFARTVPLRGYEPTRDTDIYALDCEMCISKQGKELTRVTVVDFHENVVFDALVKPPNEIIHYNTKYSGITKAMLTNATHTLASVQAELLRLINADTIIVGHGLVNDMRSLRLIHGVIFDTAIIYKTKLGARSLKDLALSKLKMIIRADENSHDSIEDARVSMKLFKYFMSRSRRRRRLMEEIEEK